MNHFIASFIIFFLILTSAKAELNLAVNASLQSGLKVINQINSPKTTISCSSDINSMTMEELEWHNSGFKNAKIHQLAVENFYKGELTHAIDLTLVNLRGTSWNQSLIEKTIKRVAEIYGKECGIKIGSAKYIEADPPRKIIHLDRELNHDILLPLRAPTNNRPLIFFPESYTDGGTARAKTRYKGNNPPILNTSFITAEVNSEGYKGKRVPGYSPTAHEIAHLLCNCGHRDESEPNILAGYYDLVNSKITKEQCDTFKRSPLVREL